MLRLDYLKAVLPLNCRYSLRVIYNKGSQNERVKNFMYNSVEELDAEYPEHDLPHTDVYYATAGFGAGKRAEADNAVAKRELYLDIDCGAGKAYPTQVDGLQALKAFVDAVGLPKPTLMDSGNGYHIHWFFTEAVPVHEWLAIATALKEKCVELGLQADHACTADLVRVLRPPGSRNSKGGNVSKLVNKLYFYSAEILAKLLEAKQGFDFAAARKLTQSKGGVQEGWKFTDPNRTTKFEPIWKSSIAGTGCAQIKYAIENADTLPEPLWRASLSIAQVCVDRDWAVHAISETHPQYEFDDAERKANATRGPYLCETFQKQDTGSLCKDCPHLGKIKSPVQLGTEISTPNLPATVPVISDAPETFHTEDPDGVVTIPSYPAPFNRGEHGGVYFHAKNGKDGAAPEIIQVVPYDIYATEIVRSTAEFTINMRVHVPNENVTTFNIPMRDVANKDALRAKLNDCGMPVFTARSLDLFQLFVREQVVAIQTKEKASAMEPRQGWTERGTFIVGNREFMRNGTVRISPITTESNLTRALTKKGDLEKWKRVINMYNNPESDAMAFGVLCGFGSVVMHMSPEYGGVVNYYSKKSGSGKTTVLRAANSIFGDPQGLMSIATDTRMSKTHRMGMLNGIVCTLDEMTNASPEEISDSLYISTQGRARNRMQSKTNEERDNNITWKCISLWSSNSSMENRMSLLKLDPQGELARMIEINLPHQSEEAVLQSKLIFDQLNENFGLAADVFIPTVVQQQDLVKYYFDSIQEQVYKLYNWTSMDRYRLNIIIAAMTGGAIAKKMGLIDFNLQRIMRMVAEHVHEGTKHIHSQSIKAVETFASYVNRYANSILEINNFDAGGVPAAPLREPHADLRIRYEPDTKSLFIGVTEFNRWCAEKQINTRELKSMFASETVASGGSLEVVKKRLGKGYKSDFGPVNAYEIKNARAVLGVEISEVKK